MVIKTGFDVDVHSKTVGSGDLCRFAVKMKKPTAKSPERYFIVTKKIDCFLVGVFHGVGFWTEDLENLNFDQDIEEVWIPYMNIDFVKSLTYVKK